MFSTASLIVLAFAGNHDIYKVTYFLVPFWKRKSNFFFQWRSLTRLVELKLNRSWPLRAKFHSSPHLLTTKGMWFFGQKASNKWQKTFVCMSLLRIAGVQQHKHWRLWVFKMSVRDVAQIGSAGAFGAQLEPIEKYCWDWNIRLNLSPMCALWVLYFFLIPTLVSKVAIQ